MGMGTGKPALGMGMGKLALGIGIGRPCLSSNFTGAAVTATTAQREMIDFQSILVVLCGIAWW